MWGAGVARIALLTGVALLGACASAPTDRNPRLPAHLERVSFAALPGWEDSRPATALAAFRRSCLSIPRGRERWADACSAAVPVPKDDEDAARKFFERWFYAFRVHNGSDDKGLFTGYYEAEIEASRERTKDYRYPIFGRPRGARRLPRKLIEACADDWVRAMEADRAPSGAQACRIVRSWPVLMWAKRRVDLFVAEIQGSARVKLADGTTTRIGYHAQNGHGYVAIGSLLIKRDIMEAEDMSMQAIREWILENPEKGAELMHGNPSYIFFREREKNKDEIGPRGAIDVPLTPGHSIAVDPRYIPLGAPLWLDTTFPRGPKERRENKEPIPLRRMLIAQDTGGAVKGTVRGDVYWGTGEEALTMAGHMKEQGRYFLLMPKGYYGLSPLPKKGGLDRLPSFLRF